MLAVGFAGGATDATAGFISITSTPLSSTGAEITNLGLVHAAWNANGNAITAPVVAGITFPNTPPSKITYSGLPANVQDSAPTGAHYTGDMVELMNDVLATNQGNTVVGTVTVSGLTIGTLYQAQLLHHHDINATTRSMRGWFGSDLDNVVLGTYTDTFDVGDNQGYITTIKFTADATTQDFSVLSIGSGDRAVLNAFAITYVPEPGTFAMLLFGGVFLCLLRKKAG